MSVVPCLPLRLCWEIWNHPAIPHGHAPGKQASGQCWTTSKGQPAPGSFSSHLKCQGQNKTAWIQDSFPSQGFGQNLGACHKSGLRPWPATPATAFDTGAGIIGEALGVWNLDVPHHTEPQSGRFSPASKERAEGAGVPAVIGRATSQGSGKWLKWVIDFLHQYEKGVGFVFIKK